MSKYQILRSNDKDPKKIVKQNRWLIIGFSIVYILVILSSNIKIFPREFRILNNAASLFLILIIVILIIRIRKQSKRMVQIGTLEFTKSCIKKEIGDFKTEYYFDTVTKIEAEKHLQAFSVIQSKSGYLTYIVKITKHNSKQDCFIVSERSLDFGRNISLSDTLKTLEKISGIEILVNSN